MIRTPADDLGDRARALIEALDALLDRAESYRKDGTVAPALAAEISDQGEAISRSLYEIASLVECLGLGSEEVAESLRVAADLGRLAAMVR